MSDLAPLKGLTKLEILFLSGSPVRDLTPLEALKERLPEIMIFRWGCHELGLARQDETKLYAESLLSANSRRRKS